LLPPFVIGRVFEGLFQNRQRLRKSAALRLAHPQKVFSLGERGLKFQSLPEGVRGLGIFSLSVINHSQVGVCFGQLGVEAKNLEEFAGSRIITALTNSLLCPLVMCLNGFLALRLPCERRS